MISSIVYQHKRALIIGINKYARDPLNYCIYDANDVKIALEKIDFDVLLNINSNQKKFYNVIDTFTESIQKDDLVLFYFAGHGKQSGDKNYLFPSDYDYDFRGNEHDYIVNHAINVDYIMKKIDDSPHSISIYIFDCCRNLVRTRATNTNQGLLHINATSQCLIVYACAPGKAVEDETRNDRNGCFMENLLRHIKTPNKDIEEIMKDVATDVHLQTDYFQLPHRASSLTSKVFLVVDDRQERMRRSASISNDTIRNHAASRYDSDGQQYVYGTKRTIHCRPSNLEPGISSMPKPGGSTCTYSDNRSQMAYSTDFRMSKKYSNPEPLVPSINVTPTKTPVKNREKFMQTPRSNIETNKSIYMKHFQNDNDDDEEEGNACNESVPLTKMQTATILKGEKPTFRKKSRKSADYSKPDNQSSKQLQNEINTPDNDPQLLNSNQTYSSLSATIDRTQYDNHSEYPVLNSQRRRDLTVFVQSLKLRYELHISVDTTIKQLKNIIWQKINISVERCQEQSHILLLFTHRIHIFLSEETELVSEFMKLTSSEPHFYFYALRRNQQSDEMYTYETKISNIFSVDTDWWTPVHFVEDAQLPRPQSVLLSSLYALRLFFYKYNDELSMWRQVMEAQFFIHLRKYLFPPAVLALKHAMEGALFWFEKPLIVDSLLQLLTSLCPLNIKRNELCDCIPLLFCWLLEQCDPTATDSDFYQLVNLIDSKSDEKRYFDDPATAVNANTVPLVMREREKISINAIRHVDVRSFTQYMQRKSNYGNIMYCKCDDYLIYDPPKDMQVPIDTIDRLTDDQVKQLYETMARKYKSFTLITRGALHSDINDQLVLMQDRTVALIFSRKIDKRPKTGNSTRAETVEHLFEIYNPLQYTVGKRQYVGSDQLYQLNKNGTQDPYLPGHLLSNVCEVPHTGSVNDPNVNAPTQQITVVALDISRSVFEKPASPDPNDSKTVLDMSIIMLGTMCDNIVFGRSAHDVGLIHFGASIEVICPITRNRNDFEKALSIQPTPQEWTSMYDALNKATTLIGTYEQSNKKSIAQDCKKLIICISDGIDNHSNTTIDQLRDRLRKYDIVVDFISFLRDDLLKENEKERVRAFRQLCKMTHGYVYQNLPLTNIELGATFEQGAAVWLCEREPKSFGLIDKPVRQMPAQLHHKATYKVPAQFAQNIQGTSNYHRVLREANNVIKAQVDNINVYVCRTDIFFWKIILNGPSRTPYEGGRWMLYIHFGPEYPRKPPSIRFVTEIYHVNVSGDGKVCHHLFERGWSNNTTMTEVFQSILQLLGEPNFDDAISTEKAQLKRDQPNEYNRQVKECTQRHGSKSLSQLKEDFELEDW